METKGICENRKNGIYYTPGTVADFLVKPLIKNSRQTIFDPAYGDGALLLAAEKRLKNNNNWNGSNLSIFGCDQKPSNGRLTHFPKANLIKNDFFNYPVNNKYDIIIMNPPYVRHYLIEPEKRCRYYKDFLSDHKIHRRADLWVYFLIKSVAHLKKMGSIGAILPWSFLQADYSQKVRQWLFDKFGEIEISASGSEYFDGTEERVLLLWLKGFGQKTRSIKISFSRELSDNSKTIELNKNSWLSSPAVTSEQHDFETILQQYVREYKFIRFEKIAKVLIGVVTGADKFFILPEPEAQNKGFKKNQLIPVLTSARDFCGLSLNGYIPSKRLITFPKKKRDYEINYLKEGEKQEFHLRSHSRLRTPWYDVHIGNTADAFFPYRMAITPYLMLNNKAQCTNSIHRIYFNNLSENEKKWVQISLLAVPGQISFENYSKTYGRGVLKIEPGALKKSIVCLSNDPAVNRIYNQISSLISLNKKHESVILATKFLNERLKIGKSFSDLALSALRELQHRRFNK